MNWQELMRRGIVSLCREKPKAVTAIFRLRDPAVNMPIDLKLDIRNCMTWSPENQCSLGGPNHQDVTPVPCTDSVTPSPAGEGRGEGVPASRILFSES